MKLAILKERRASELRVAATPETVKKFVGLGFEVTIEAGAGLSSQIPDQLYADMGATVAASAADAVKGADVVLKVQRPLRKGEGELDELALLKPGMLLIGALAPYADTDAVKAYAEAGITACSLELLPRITRAQSMDILSSQSNLSGYRAVIDAAYEFRRGMPMLMTAAGTVAPARVMVLGAGVAGLQAIATAKRMGAIVSATDVRPAAKEEVESLGGKFVMVESEETATAQTEGGYAKEMSDDYKRKQAELVAETLKKQDIAICTALIPGKKAPTLISKEMVHSMKPGSVIIDLAVEQGGNCELAKVGEVVEVKGVKIVGHVNVPSRVATDSSSLYAKNLLNFITPMIDKESQQLKIDWEDEIISAVTLTRDGKVVNPAMQGS